MNAKSPVLSVDANLPVVRPDASVPAAPAPSLQQELDNIAVAWRQEIESLPTREVTALEWESSGDEFSGEAYSDAGMTRSELFGADSDEVFEELRSYDNFFFHIPATRQEELRWAELAKGCFTCGRTQPECELIWAFDEEDWVDLHPGYMYTEAYLRNLCRPRPWICAFDTVVCMPRALCSSCYQRVENQCMVGVWNMDFMWPAFLQLLLPFADTEAAVRPQDPPFGGLAFC